MKNSSSISSSTDRTDKHKKKTTMSFDKVRASHILIKHEGFRRKASWKDPEGQVIMNALTLFCTASLIDGGLYWFVCVLGPAEQKGKSAVHLSGDSISADKVQDNYKQSWSFFRRPKEIELTENVPAFVLFGEDEVETMGPSGGLFGASIF